MSLTLAMQAGDLLIQANGQLLLVGDTDKGAQDLDQQLTTTFDDETEQGSRLYMYFGGGEGLPRGTAEAFIVDEVHRCVGQLQALQRNDPDLDVDEEIGAVESLRVEERAGSFFVFLEVSTASGEVFGIPDFEVRSLRSPEVRETLAAVFQGA